MECWSAGVLGRCNTPSLQQTITPRSCPSRLAGRILVGLSLLALILTGCGPESGKAGKQSATNAVAPRLLAKTNPAPTFRPVARTNRPPAVTPTTAKAKAAPPATRPAPKTIAAPAVARPGAGTNAAAAVARTRAGTNAVKAAGAKARFSDTLRNLQANRAFYPVLGVVFVCLCLAGILVVRLLQAKSAKAKTTAPPAVAPKVLARPAKRKAGKVAIHCCNVLQVGSQARQVWHFDARGRGFVLNREQTSFAGEALPTKLVAKDWQTLWRRKLNIAWLPPERVFLRVAQFPTSDFDETLAMVELQLEKLSPMPVTQIVWTIQVLPHAEGNLQTVIVMIVARNDIEQFLGQLEGQGYLADRLDLPLLDQLQATIVTQDGAWIYPEAPGGRNAALVAWWYGGVLQNLDLVTLPAANRPESLKEQLLQMAWAGELEGWLTAPPAWHLVADAAVAAEWEPALRAGLEQPVEVSTPVPVTGLAGLTATRAAQAGAEGNLLPPEFSNRYQQQFVDRLWMRGLGAVLGLYLVGVLIYFAWLQFAQMGTSKVEQQVANLGPTYTNALQLKARLQILKDRQDLKYAALDCWKAVAERLPEGLTLDGFHLSDGKRLTLSGTAPSGQEQQLFDFENDIRKATANAQPLFAKYQEPQDQIKWDPPRGNPPMVSWRFALKLNRTEAL